MLWVYFGLPMLIISHACRQRLMPFFLLVTSPGLTETALWERGHLGRQRVGRPHSQVNHCEAAHVQPLAQFLAAFPANLMFPVFVIVIVRFGLNADIWLSPLIVLGTQWYILFNVIASAYPNDYREVAANFHIRGWQWWRQVMLPGIFPYYVTGAITAPGGAWNAQHRGRVRRVGRHQNCCARAGRLHRANHEGG
jgi:hypothetical protein